MTREQRIAFAFDVFRSETERVPLGAEDKHKGQSIYNWRMFAVREIERLADAITGPEDFVPPPCPDHAPYIGCVKCAPVREEPAPRCDLRSTIIAHLDAAGLTQARLIVEGLWPALREEPPAPCACTHEAGDSPCPVHGMDEEYPARTPCCPVPGCHAGMLREGGRDVVSCPVCEGTITAEQYATLAAPVREEPRRCQHGVEFPGCVKCRPAAVREEPPDATTNKEE